MGLVSQEVEEVMPSLVHVHEHAGFADFKFLDYIQVIPLLLGALQDAQERICALESEVVQLVTSMGSG